MGYTTDFSGEFKVTPTMSAELVAELKEFNRTDHREEENMPGIWCQWAPVDDGTAIDWDGEEKFYDYVPWIRYLIEHKLQGHTLNGVVTWMGEDPDDSGVISISNNVVIVDYNITVIESKYKIAIALAGAIEEIDSEEERMTIVSFKIPGGHALLEDFITAWKAEEQ